MPNSIFTLPTTFVADITKVMGALFTDLAPYIALVVGVLLGLAAIGWLISYLKHKD